MVPDRMRTLNKSRSRKLLVMTKHLQSVIAALMSITSVKKDQL